MLNVWCQQCSSDPPLASVHESTDGFVFDAMSTHRVQMADSQRRQLLQRWKGRGAKVPFVAAGRSAVLLDRTGGETPKVECVHGEVEVDPHLLMRLIEHRPNRGPAKLLVHRIEKQR